MSEFNPADYSDFDEEMGRIRRKRLGLAFLAATGLSSIVGLGIWGAQEISDAMHRPPKPEIIAGVPAQVEAREKKEVCKRRYSNQTCAVMGTEYTLRVEQCPADIATVQRGEEIVPSYDRQVGEIAPGCISGEFVVSETVYKYHEPGSEIIPTGTTKS